MDLYDKQVRESVEKLAPFFRRNLAVHVGAHR
jgi:hypothetical protein